MAMDITPDMIDRAALVLVIDEDGLVEWSATKTNEEVGTALVSLGESLFGAPAVTPLVVVVRDPDASNEFSVFDGEVETLDVDLGYLDLSDHDEFTEWKDSLAEQVWRIRSTHPEAAEYVWSIVENNWPDDLIQCCDDGCGLHVDHDGPCAPR